MHPVIKRTADVAMRMKPLLKCADAVAIASLQNEWQSLLLRALLVDFVRLFRGLVDILFGFGRWEARQFKALPKRG